jgi:hypothetical protein
MDAAEQDVHQTLEYRGDATIAGLLPFGLMLCFLASLVLALDDRPDGRLIAAVCIVAPAGIGLIAAALWRRRRPGRPMFVLSPRGVHYRLASEYVLVPWREIQGIDSVDVRSWNFSIGRSRTVTFCNVTVILVSRKFYETHILLPFWRRGPGWRATFIPKGGMIQFALNHELVSIEARALRAAVEARWHAFRSQPTAGDMPAPPARTSVPHVRARTRIADAALPPPGIALGKPRPMSAWDAVKVIVPLIGIVIALTNVLGLWATAGQTEAREERRQWAEQERQRQEEQRKFDENVKRIQKERDDYFRRMEAERFPRPR